MISKKQFEKLFPLACEWAIEQEKIILKKGVSLNENQQNDALLIGVKNVQKVRLLKVKTIPMPSLPALKSIVETSDLLTDDTIGITFRYGIYIREEFWNKRSLIVHELTHTMQYERLGGIEPFLNDYLDECINIGYPDGPLEQEAIKMEKKIYRRRRTQLKN